MESYNAVPPPSIVFMPQVLVEVKDDLKKSSRRSKAIKPMNNLTFTVSTSDINQAPFSEDPKGNLEPTTTPKSIPSHAPQSDPSMLLHIQSPPPNHLPLPSSGLLPVTPSQNVPRISRELPAELEKSNLLKHANNTNKIECVDTVQESPESSIGVENIYFSPSLVLEEGRECSSWEGIFFEPLPSQPSPPTARRRTQLPKNGKNSRPSGASLESKDGATDKKEKSESSSCPKGRMVFNEHLRADEVSIGLKKGNYCSATIRFNAHNRFEAYATLEGIRTDILVPGPAAQNRSLEGDVVALQLDKPSDWPKLPVRKDKIEPLAEQISNEGSSKEALFPTKSEGAKSGPQDLKETSSSPIVSGQLALVNSVNDSLASFPERRPSGRVVAILEPSKRREAVIGCLEVPEKWTKLCGSAEAAEKETKAPAVQEGSLLLVPKDARFPKMVVHVSGLPEALKARLRAGDATLGTTLVAARVDRWRTGSYLPLAVVRTSLGQAGEIAAETAGVIFQHGIHSQQFPEAALACLPPNVSSWKVPDAEVARRRDLRLRRIVTIDPATARDLDDALSIEELPGGTFLVGVHIADVSHFVPPQSPLDSAALQRATSVYLVQSVVPMLPRGLCEGLCSLNPGVDRLAFSVQWEVSGDGEVLGQEVFRSVIRCCAKLSYGDAQAVLEGGEGSGKIPEVQSPHTWDAVANDIVLLDRLAKKLRQKRYDNGAVSLNGGSSKLQFTLDSDGDPVDAIGYELRDSNRLVEEFMLLANMAVARAISAAFPDASLLRCHPEPSFRKLQEFSSWCSTLGLPFDVSSSKSIHESLEALRAATRATDSAIFEILTMHATKPMQLAKYFCTGERPGEEEKWGHYALATPYYTHFTSPIRRYPDLVVHRILAAVLEAEASLVGKIGEPGKSGTQNGEARGKMKGRKGKKGGNGKVVPANAQNGGAMVVSAVAAEMKPRGGGKAAVSGGIFTGVPIDERLAKSEKVRKVLGAVAKKHGLLSCDRLSDVAKHCNERKLASKNAQEASDKIYLCVMLKKRKGVLSDARVMGLGPKFMTVYVRKFGVERSIYYEDMKGVKADWFESTSTLVLSLAEGVEANGSNHGSNGRHGRGRAKHRLEGGVDFVSSDDIFEGLSEEDLDVALANIWAGDEVSDEQSDVLNLKEPAAVGGKLGDSTSLDAILSKEVQPAVLPLTLRMFSAVPVLVYATGGGNQPLDVAIKLHILSYFAGMDSVDLL